MRIILCAVGAWLVLVSAVQPASGQGIFLSACGPVSRGMGGATTAAPTDALGALYWNPATTAATPTEIGFGLDLLFPILQTSSSITGLGEGTTTADPGVTPIPSFGLVDRAEGSNITWGLGILPIAGFKTNYPASTTNPLFAPQSNAAAVPGGMGRTFTQANFFQITPTMTIALTDQLSLGFGPTITLGEAIVDPLLLASMDDADASGVPRWGSGRGSRYHWGGGAQLGLYYITDSCWHLGASIKTPQWMERFQVNSEDELGRPIVREFDIDLPMIVSAGTAYSGFENLLLSLDVRYFDYKNAEGFNEHGFDPDGSLRGLGMSSIVAVATGAQLRLSEVTWVRLGYTFNQSPMHDGEATVAVPAPLYYQHQLHTGLSRQMTERMTLNFAYTYYFEADLSGPIVTPLGAVPNSNVTTSESAHIASFGVTVRY